jgi:nuclear pore complex protein Nup205
MENGNPIERKNWFADIEPLFKLLGYENVPPYLKVDSVIFMMLY